MAKDSTDVKAYPKVAQLRTTSRLLERCRELGIELPCDEQLLSAEDGSPMASPMQVDGLELGNRWCIHPMEGWDANRDGTPTEFTLRRWQRFGESGAKLIWGGEAAAVREDGRANPNQTLAVPENRSGLQLLLKTLKDAHYDQAGSLDGLVVGLQLTHSGRFCKPDDHHQLQPRIAFHHPLLDAKFGIAADDEQVVFSDDELDDLIEAYVRAAQLAAEVGFDFVDIKACHGYLLHEMLSARVRPGRFGGDLAGRTLMLRTIIEKVRQTCPSLHIGVRLSLFDLLPFEPGQGRGQPMTWPKGEPYQFGLGHRQDDPLTIDLSEPIEIMRMLRDCGVCMVNLTGGSPYYNPHIQRPAIFPPSDGYAPPEDPLVGVARHIQSVAEVKRQLPDLPLVGSGYTYLQEFLPLVAQATVRAGMVDFVGLGRMVLSYPQLPHDSLAGSKPARKLVCRTFSDCTTAPRKGIISGCYPLDEFYKRRPEREQLEAAKKATQEQQDTPSAPG